MPQWAIHLLEWAVGLLLQQLDSDQAKKTLASILESVDALLQAAESRVSGPFEGVADEVAAAFHTAVVAICAALRQK